MNLLEQCKPGEQTKISIPVPQGKGLPAYLFRGVNPGQTLVVTAGVHGCEYVGVQAVRELIRQVDPQTLSGNVIFVPVTNEQGFFAGSKQITPEDGLNLNRRFPGSAQGTLTDRIAFAVQENLYPVADFLVDLHGGDIHESMTPLVFFPVAAGPELHRITRAAAGCLSVEYRVQSRADNGLYSYAAQCNIPAVLIERGGGGKWSPDEVAAYKRNIFELMGFLGICPQEGPLTPPVEIAEAVYEEAVAQGFWYCNAAAGQKVPKGYVLGRLEDFDGTIIKTYTAGFDGVVLYLTNSLGVIKGEGVFAFGKLP